MAATNHNSIVTGMLQDLIYLHKVLPREASHQAKVYLGGLVVVKEIRYSIYFCHSFILLAVSHRFFLEVQIYLMLSLAKFHTISGLYCLLLDDCFCFFLIVNFISLLSYHIMETVIFLIAG